MFGGLKMVEHRGNSDFCKEDSRTNKFWNYNSSSFIAKYSDQSSSKTVQMWCILQGLTQYIALKRKKINTNCYR